MTATNANSANVEDALGADLTRAFSNLEPPSSPLPFPPTLDLDSDVLPPLDDLSTVEETLGFGSLSFDLPTSFEHVSPPSDSSVSSRSMGSPERDFPKSPLCCPNVRAALDEVSARLKAASTENAALRTRVADLVRENRSLRSNLDVAQKQAQANPLLLGLAQVSAEAAGALANALNTVPKPPPGKKRKRAAVGKTLACVVLMCGFFFGSPNVIKNTERTEANLPAIWGGESKGGVVMRSNHASSDGNGMATPPVRPSLCLRTLEQLPPPELASKTEDEIKSEMKQTVKMEPETAKVNGNPNAVAAEVPKMAIEPAMKKRRVDQFSYVMCRDAPDAVRQVSACSKKMEEGHACGSPHEISLIMPAAALRDEASLEGETDKEDDFYAEVRCSILSVRKIIGGQTPKVVSGAAAANLAMTTMETSLKTQKHVAVGPRMGAGRVLASVREEVVGT